MPRRKRNWRPDAYYHVVMRGNNRENIFATNEDMYHLMRTIGHAHNDYRFSIMAFCIMTNHYHLLIRSEDELSKIMMRINRKYSDYYSKRYHHVGRIYQKRYYSTAIEDPQGLLAVSRYIHRNPIETQIPMVKELTDYPFSSFPYYSSPHSFSPPYLDTETILRFLPSLEKTKDAYCEYCLAEVPVHHKIPTLFR